VIKAHTFVVSLLAGLLARPLAVHEEVAVATREAHHLVGGDLGAGGAGGLARLAVLAVRVVVVRARRQALTGFNYNKL